MGLSLPLLQTLNRSGFVTVFRFSHPDLCTRLFGSLRPQTISNSASPFMSTRFAWESAASLASPPLVISTALAADKEDSRAFEYVLFVDETCLF
jgi:hypothetical protein